MGGLQRQLSSSLSSLSMSSYPSSSDLSPQPSDTSTYSCSTLPSKGRKAARKPKYHGKAIKVLLQWVQRCTLQWVYKISNLLQSFKSCWIQEYSHTSIVSKTKIPTGYFKNSFESVRMIICFVPWLLGVKSFILEKNLIKLFCQLHVKLSRYGLEVHDFGKSWRSGLAFLALVKSINPVMVDLRESFFRDPKENIQQAFMIAHHSLDIPPLLEPEGKSFLTYSKSKRFTLWLCDVPRVKCRWLHYFEKLHCSF